MKPTARRSARAPVGAVRSRVARAFDGAIALTALVTLALFVAGALAPRFGADIRPDAVSSDGGHAFTFSPGFSVSWPYAVPSHPDSVLEPDDVLVMEDGRPVGTLEPAHAAIRERGGGLHNLWQGTLWFSPSDDTDPRTDGRPYRLEVQTRLAPSAVKARDGSAEALLALVLCRLGLSAFPAASRAGRRSARAASDAWRAGHAALGRAVEAAARPARHAIRRIPLTFGRCYALVGTLVLGGFLCQTLARPAPLFTQSDTFSYIFPGLMWSSGRDMAGMSIRGLGYPALTLVAVRLGSLTTLPRLQLVVVSVGIACLLGALYLSLSAISSRLERVAAAPRWLCATAAAAVAAAFVALLASHDLFVIDIESAMAEAPHVLPTALAALLFVGGWIARSGGWKVGLLALATLAAYASAMIKPHTLVVVLLCSASWCLVALRHRRAFRSSAVVATCLVAATLTFGLNRLNAWITPQDVDFGPKILFCNHLDVIEPVFDVSTPERVRVAALMHDTLSRVDGWPLLGYAGDECIYNPGFTQAIIAAAAADGDDAPRWEGREFLKGVLRNPLRYARDIAHQTAWFMRHPVANIDMTAHSDLAEADAKVLAPFASIINMRRDEWDADVANWVPAAYPWIAGPAKRALGAISDLFLPVTLLGTVLASVVAIAFRKADLRAETAIIATACFAAAFAAMVILTHSFDVGRYVTDILPISLLWWVSSALYLVHSAIVVLAVSLRGYFRHRISRTRSPTPTGAF